MSYPLQLRRSAFTFVEILVAVAVLGIFTGGAFWALLRLNEYAMRARLSTAAQALAQEQLDQMQSQRPFNPQRMPPDVPAVLQTTSSSGVTETNLPLFTDPVTNAVVVWANRARVVTLVSSTNRLYRLQSTVTYNFRGRSMPPVTVTSMRTSDE